MTLKILPSRRQGFTLIELAVVLVIIGLVAGGILVGRNLIASAGLRSLMTQTNSYKTAVATFRLKYEHLPGDIPAGEALRFGFVSRGDYAGTGDGNGFVEGVWMYTAGANGGQYDASGETLLFWRDLSDAKLIDASFTLAIGTMVPVLTSTQLPLYFPRTAIGADGYVTVRHNVFRYTALGSAAMGVVMGKGTGPYDYNFLTTRQTHAIDSKMDDGRPGSGTLVASPSTGSACTTTSATAGSSQTCCDNGNVGGNAMSYSLTQSGERVNCYYYIRNVFP